MPVLAIGGEASFGEHVGEAVQTVADDVQGAVVIAASIFLDIFNVFLLFLDLFGGRDEQPAV